MQNGQQQTVAPPSNPLAGQLAVIRAFADQSCRNLTFAGLQVSGKSRAGIREMRNLRPGSVMDEALEASRAAQPALAPQAERERGAKSLFPGYRMRKPGSLLARPVSQVSTIRFSAL